MLQAEVCAAGHGKGRALQEEGAPGVQLLAKRVALAPHIDGLRCLEGGKLLAPAVEGGWWAEGGLAMGGASS